ncbi:MAG TPA: VOC family protein [Chloroflexota bacterium]|nr:VOC family protein [Chloroflexota bacterium]
MAQTVMQAIDQSIGTKSPVQVRKLGHVVLWVSDIERSVQFYTEILNFRVSDWEKRPDRQMVFLNACGDHHTVALFSRPGGQMPPPEYLQLSHFALEVGHIDELFAIREFLKSRGVPIRSEGRKGAGCNIDVSFDDPDGYHVELYCNMDQVGRGDRPRPASQFHPTSTLEEARDNPVPACW